MTCSNRLPTRSWFSSSTTGFTTLSVLVRLVSQTLCLVYEFVVQSSGQSQPKSSGSPWEQYFHSWRCCKSPIFSWYVSLSNCFRLACQSRPIPYNHSTSHWSLCRGCKQRCGRCYGYVNRFRGKYSCKLPVKLAI